MLHMTEPNHWAGSSQMMRSVARRAGSFWPVNPTGPQSEGAVSVGVVDARRRLTFEANPPASKDESTGDPPAVKEVSLILQNLLT